MSFKVENLDHNMVRITVEVPSLDLEQAVNKVFNRQKSQFVLRGFRKGKVPRALIERMYGANVFVQDALNDLIPLKWREVAEESDLDFASHPSIDLVQGEAGKPVIFTVEIAVTPKAELGQYKGVEVPKQDLTVTEEEIDQRINEERDKNARTVEVEEAKEGSIVTLDFEGTVDGEVFEGGTAADYKLTIGSGSFIPGFEEQLIGVKAGDHRDVTVTFPENYIDELKGREAVFACDIHKVEDKELPEADDEFAQDVSECETFAEYREEVRGELEEKKKEAAKSAIENAAIEKAAENLTVDIPEAMIEAEAEAQVDRFMNQFAGQGMDAAQIEKMFGQSRQQMVEASKDGAEKQIRTRLLLQAVAEAENLTVTEEDREEEMKKLAEKSNMTLEEVKSFFGEENKDFDMQVRMNKAVKLIADSAVEV